MNRRQLLSVSASSFALPLTLGHGAARKPSSKRRVVLISIDGLRPDLYLHPERHDMKLPTLRGLMAAGAYAEGVTGVYPTVTYPSHTTLITGALPARHGIIGNEVFDPADARPPWFFEHKQIRATTLFTAARRRGLKTASIMWPVTVGAPVDWLIPEVFDTKRREKNLFRKTSTPHLYEKIEEKYGAGGFDDWDDWGRKDERIADCAEWILGNRQPDFTAIHYVNGDHQQHETGLETPEVRRAFEQIDAQVGRVLAALDSAGTRRETTVVVTGDHGFLEVQQTVSPNIVLHNAGLQELSGESVLQWAAYVWTQGASGGVYVKNRSAIPRVRKLLEEAVVTEPKPPLTFVSRWELDKLGAYPGAAFAVECARGFRMGRSSSGDFVTSSRTKGMHGYLPTKPEMRTGFIMSGAGAQRGVNLGQLRMVDIAPTIGKLLDVRLPEATGKSIDRALS